MLEQGQNLRGKKQELFGNKWPIKKEIKMTLKIIKLCSSLHIIQKQNNANHTRTLFIYTYVNGFT